ncbi:MAG: outer membrane lipid asymmetry maintenance protein MlaD [Candidatus Paracaedimonas acanthamoebae]|uniref:Outer membrane lipid asymmetry maintenance protein MlaD n=1 Tax=Candidatus Paracaedimonas acanthamoebae TaxID=244581 RepID=A0A8J7TTT1_9PROT|nr:outer membrane lipid asymmetry maintenance protein MlaD [Candidatus Paracaedimonas acanthamoebae]
MRNNLIETVMGGVVLLIAIFFLTFAYRSSGYKSSEGALYWAQFDRVDGLFVGSDVRMSGVKVGTVKDIKINPQTYLAGVHFTLASDISLPKDSSAEILSDGLMGNKYLALIPGGDEENLPSGAEITHTQSAVSLEGMIGQLIFSAKDSKKEGAQPSAEKK